MRHLLSKNSLSPKQKGLQSFQLPDHFLSILGFIANFHKLPLVNVTNVSLGSCGVLVTMIVAGQIYMAWFSYCLYRFFGKARGAKYLFSHQNKCKGPQFVFNYYVPVFVQKPVNIWCSPL